MLLIVILFTIPVYGADILTRMLYADEVESFAEDQDAIILFQVLEIDDKVIEADVLQVITGEVSDDKIKISNEEIRILGMLPDSYLYTGDFCVMSVKNYGNYYKQAWAALKADSGDYKTLRFYYSSHFEDIDVLQYFVNSGGLEKDFRFEEGSVFAVTDNGVEVNITLPSEGYLPEVEIVKDIVEIETKSKESIVKEERETEVSFERPFIFLLFGLSLIVGISGYWLGRWVRRKRG